MNLSFGDKVKVAKHEGVVYTGTVLWLRGEEIGVEIEGKVWKFPASEVTKID